MDPKQFDALVQSLTTRGTRRAAVQALAGALAVLGAGGLDWAPDTVAAKARGKAPAKATGKGHGAPKQKHHHHHHGSGGTCTTDAAGEQGSAVTQTSQTSFNGQVLQATQTVQPVGANHETASQLDVTLAGAAVLSIATEIHGQTVTVTLTYGAAFGGIGRAHLINDGTTITGDIDGRAIVPLPATSDPSKTRFADGAPPPDVQVDPDLAKALQTLLRQAHQAAKSCKPAPATGATARRRGVRPAAHPEQNAVCLALYIPCETGYATCAYGAAVGCAAALYFYGVCLTAALLTCTYASLVCRKGVRVGGTCCPTPCGGSTDVANPFSDDPSCCERGETCVDPTSNASGCCANGTHACAGVNCCKADETCQPNGQCCAPGASLCGEVCCPNGSCQNGQCCNFPDHPCGASCCPSLSPCCAGQCCSGICTNGVCCVAPATYCNGSCCATNCCNGVCCPAGQGCSPTTGSCAQLCTGRDQYTCPAVPGNPPCCRRDLATGQREECCPGVGCCAVGLQCCSVGNGVNACKTTCVA